MKAVPENKTLSSAVCTLTQVAQVKLSVKHKQNTEICTGAGREWGDLVGMRWGEYPEQGKTGWEYVRVVKIHQGLRFNSQYYSK